MPRKDEVRQARHHQTLTRYASCLEAVDLGEQRGHVDHDPVADDGCDVVIQDARGHQLQGVTLFAHHHGVAGIVPALITHHVSVIGGE